MNDKSPPLAENEYVKELLDILRDNGKDTAGLASLLDHVSVMEDFVVQAEGRIADMKEQLEEMREIQNHPVKTALRNAIKSLEVTVAAVKEQISELKADIIDGAKNAIAAFKEKGITALDTLASFFRISDGLQAVKNNIVKDISTCDKTMATNFDFAKQYRKVSNGMKNMARILVGKKPVSAKKEGEKLAWALNAPYRAHKTCLLVTKNAINAALGKLEQLERRADVLRVEKPTAKKSGLDALIETGKEKIAHRDRERQPPQHNPQERGAVI